MDSLPVYDIVHRKWRNVRHKRKQYMVVNVG